MLALALFLFFLLFLSLRQTGRISKINAFALIQFVLSLSFSVFDFNFNLPVLSLIISN